MQNEDLVLEIAREVGFDLVGIAPLEPPPDGERFAAWLAAGRHGSMDYLARNRERILDPRRILPQGKSLLVLGLAHSRPAFCLPDGARVARYAAGRDYHNVAGRMLKKLARRLEQAGLGGRSRSIVDAGPLLERSHAAQAGLGFASKAANLLHPDFGPWFFLAELLLEVELAPTTAPAAGSCGTCRACIDACPTGAILEPGLVHAPDCISYQTIENRSSIPRSLRSKIGPWAFGCDVCSEVCPWGEGAPDASPAFGTHRALAEAGLVRWIEVEDASFDAWLEGSPLKRPRRAGLARNAAIALAHQPSERGREALLRALSFDPAPIVRAAAGWSLAEGHAGGAEVRESLERALRAEDDPETRADLQQSLDSL